MFESHPNKQMRTCCRNTNMAALRNNTLFLKIMHKQFANLQRIEQELLNDNSKRHKMWKEATMIFLDILLSESNLSKPKLTIKIVPNNEEFCFLWDLKKLPKFYNKSDNQDHWSIVQKNVCAMIV